jgi:hypothetical protein
MSAFLLPLHQKNLWSFEPNNQLPESAAPWESEPTHKDTVIGVSKGLKTSPVKNRV